MRIRLVEDRQTWEALIGALPHGNILQSYEWGEFKSTFGWQPIRLLLESDGQPIGGAQLLLRRSPLGAVAYVPRGPLVDFAAREATDRLLGAIHGLARSAGAIFLKVEPNVPSARALAAQLTARGFRAAAAVQPRSTIVVDLRPDPAALMRRLNSRTRYNIRLAERRGLRCVLGGEQDLPVFYSLLTETARRGDFAVHPLGYYCDLWRRFGSCGQAHLLLVGDDEGPLAATMFLTMGGVASQFYSASAANRRHLKPNELLQWKALLHARELGCRAYDLWGIPDEVGQMVEQSCGERREAPRCYDERSAAGTMQGVYLFKRGFGGEVVRTLGAYDYVYAPARYWLWTRAVPTARRASLLVAGVVRGRNGADGSASTVEAYEA